MKKKCFDYFFSLAMLSFLHFYILLNCTLFHVYTVYIYFTPHLYTYASHVYQYFQYHYFLVHWSVYTKFNNVSFHRFFGIKNKYPCRSCNFIAETARHLHGKRRCCMLVMHTRFSIGASDDFCFIRFKIKRPTSYGNIFMQFQRSRYRLYSQRIKIHVKIEYYGLLGLFSLIFRHLRVTSALLSFQNFP